MNIDKDINEALEEVKLHKEGKLELQTYEEFEKEMNIDKEIENNIKKENRIKNIIARAKEINDKTKGQSAESIQGSLAIDVLILGKELEKYKRLAEANLKDAEDYKQNMCEHRCLVKQHYEEELETWKKIAEKLAEQNVKSREYYCVFDTFTKEDFIDWARNEVSNGK